jgi:thymidine phosphorylase
VLHRKVADRVQPGDELLTIHAATEADAERVEPYVRDAFEMVDDPVAAPAVIVDTVL